MRLRRTRGTAGPIRTHGWYAERTDQRFDGDRTFSSSSMTDMILPMVNSAILKVMQDDPTPRNSAAGPPVHKSYDGVTSPPRSRSDQLGHPHQIGDRACGHLLHHPAAVDLHGDLAQSEVRPPRSCSRSRRKPFRKSASLAASTWRSAARPRFASVRLPVVCDRG